MPILDHPWQIELYRLGVLKHRLRLEISGLEFKRGRITTLQATNDTLVRNNVPGAPFLTKSEALVALLDYIDKKEQEAKAR